VRKILSPRRVAGVPNLCNGWGQWAENMDKAECCSGFGKGVLQFIPGKSSVTGDHVSGSLKVSSWKDEIQLKRKLPCGKSQAG